MRNQLKYTAVSATALLAGKSLVLQIFTTAVNILLARILAPQIFGVFAIISFIVVIFSFFCDVGLSVGLIQKKIEPTTDELRTVFTLQLFLSIASSLVLWFTAPVIISYYGDQVNSETVWLLRILVLTLPATTIGNVSRSLMERPLLYTRVVMVDILTLILAKGLAVVLVLQGFTIFALVISDVLAKLGSSVISLILSPWDIGLSLNWRRFRQLISFGLDYQISTWVLVFGSAVLPIYIGKYPGPGGWNGVEAVGFATFATSLAGFSRFFYEIIARVALPLISRTQTDLTIAGKTIEKTLETATLISFGIMSVIFSFTPDVIKFFYTGKWLPAGTFLRLQLIQSAEIAVGLMLMNTLLALGMSRTYRNLHIFWAILLWILTIPLVKNFGFNGFGIAGIIVSATSVILPYLILKQKITFSFWAKFLPELGIAILTTLVLLLVRKFVPIQNLIQLLCILFFGLLLYAVFVYIFLKRVLISNINYFWAILKKQRKPITGI